MKHLSQAFCKMLRKHAFSNRMTFKTLSILFDSSGFLASLAVQIPGQGFPAWSSDGKPLLEMSRAAGWSVRLFVEASRSGQGRRSTAGTAVQLVFFLLQAEV